jgi:hypothetical protein
MTNELKHTVSALEHADDNRKKAPKANFRFFKDIILPDHSVNVEVDGRIKAMFLVNGQGEPLLVYLGEKGNDQHTLNLRTGKFLYLNGRACSEA